jgi:hypothetical protein
VFDLARIKPGANINDVERTLRNTRMAKIADTKCALSQTCVSPHSGAPHNPSSQAGWPRRFDVLSMFHVSIVSLAAASRNAGSAGRQTIMIVEGAEF